VAEDLFSRRLQNFAQYGDLLGFNLACVAEALDTIAHLNELNVGGEVVQERIGEFKEWDPEIFRVDKDCEDGYVRRLEERGQPTILLSEEAERVELNTSATGEPIYAVSDPFDGSYLFKRGIPDFWYTSLAFYSHEGKPLTAVVGDAVHGVMAFASDQGAYVGRLAGDRLEHVFALNAEYRRRMGRKVVQEIEEASVESYAMKPGSFLKPLVDEYAPLLYAFKFFLPNGGPYGFVDVAEGKIDVYFARQQPFVDVFPGLLIALQGETVVTDFSGGPVQFVPDVHTRFDVLVSTNRTLHDKVLEEIARCRGGGQE